MQQKSAANLSSIQMNEVLHDTAFFQEKRLLKRSKHILRMTYCTNSKDVYKRQGDDRADILSKLLVGDDHVLTAADNFDVLDLAVLDGDRNVDLVMQTVNRRVVNAVFRIRPGNLRFALHNRCV